MSNIDIKAVRQAITNYIKEITLDRRVIDTLLCDNEFLPKECELWDYKRQGPNDPVSLGKTILHIVSFYNTYGGYIVYGIEEVKSDKKFHAIGIQENDINLQRIKDNLTNHTGAQIDISYKEHLYEIGEERLLLGLLHIPKRKPSEAPIFFGKNGPEDDKGRCVFHQNEAYLRALDKCMPATSKHDYQLLFSERSNPFLWDTEKPIYFSQSHRIIVDHNLPDRNFICPRFFGREDILEQLWKWFADDLANSIVLAGDGGKGKTSIAYEFAEEVCRAKPYDMDKVIWLTAKEKQFVAHINEFVKVPETHFFDSDSLLRALCSELAILDKETEGASLHMLKMFVKNAMASIPCLVVIDNVDSCELDEQKVILETALQTSNPQARFLLTTRMNVAYSNESSITVGGLQEFEYIEYARNLIEIIGGPNLTTQQIERMRKATDGSPLFTESLLRLCRTGVPFNDAIQQWKGKLGSEARKAALQREIEQLSVESRRVLLACSYMQEASLTELKQATAYENERLYECIAELQSLFLVNAQPFIKREPRFAVSNNTALLVMENQQMLVSDPKALERIVTNLRKKRVGKSHALLRTRRVGAAITQANALLFENRHDEAIKTVDSALEFHKDDPDLFLTKGRCLIEKYKSTDEKQSLNMARKAFSKSEKLGQRKEKLFHLWYESEMAANDPNGGIEVSTLALDYGIPIQSEWLMKRGEAHLSLSRALKSAVNWDGAVDEILFCSQDIGQALKLFPPRSKNALYQLLYQVNDEAWPLVNEVKFGLRGLRDIYNTAKQFIRQGDRRPLSYKRFLDSAMNLCSRLETHGEINEERKKLLVRIDREIDDITRPQRLDSHPVIDSFQLNNGRESVKKKIAQLLKS